MLKTRFGQYVLELDTKLFLPTHLGELTVTEDDLRNGLKGYRLDETLEALGEISKSIFHDSFPREWQRLGGSGIQHPSGVFLTQFAIEYLASAAILSGGNNWKKGSIKHKDNLLGLFNIYSNGLTDATVLRDTLTSLLVPMYFQQFSSQKAPKALFVRQWCIFSKVCSRIASGSSLNLEKVFEQETGMTVLEYTKLSFVVFAKIIASPCFNIESLSKATIPGGLVNVLTDVNLMRFVRFIGANYSEFRELDRSLNSTLDPMYTKARFNPLWLKPIIQINERQYLAPSITAYMTATFKGLFWWFDTYFRKQSRKAGDTFRIRYGQLFEEYVGDVLKDLYGDPKVLPAIKYSVDGDKKLFFDWIVDVREKVFLFEVKGYQFPLEVLQKGNPDAIRKEVINKIVKAIVQMYKRIQDIEHYNELVVFRKRDIVPIAVFYDIPLISTDIYQESIRSALSDLEIKHPGIQSFNYYMMSIEELEDYYYIADICGLDEVLKRVKVDSHTGFTSELKKINGDRNVRRSYLDRMFENYCSDVIEIRDRE